MYDIRKHSCVFQWFVSSCAAFVHVHLSQLDFSSVLVCIHSVFIFTIVMNANYVLFYYTNFLVFNIKYFVFYQI